METPVQKHTKIRGFIQGKVDIFQKKISIGHKLLVSDPYLLYVKNMANLKPWNNSGLPGVYIYLTPQNIFYIGKSEVKMGDRIWNRIGKEGNEKNPYPDAEDWVHNNKDNIAFVTIPLEPNLFWLAAALEAFLIWQIENTEYIKLPNSKDSLKNRIGRNRSDYWRISV
jgi:hypothetical protein